MRDTLLRGVIGMCLLALGLAGAASLMAQKFPPQPGPRDFIVDEASLIEPQDQAEIKSICDRLLTERRIPIVVVTIQSLPFDASDIEAYARALFDRWGIGYKGHNFGILLLVSPGDRKARIELGADYQHSKDETARMIMQEIIIPNFKKGKYSEGILEGVKALDTMARGLPVRAPQPWWKPWVFFGLLFLGVGVAISLIRSGNKGWGWALLAVIFAIVAAVLISAARSGGGGGGDWGGGGGGGGGGSFGGGSGGGGGATGSW